MGGNLLSQTIAFLLCYKKVKLGRKEDLMCLPCFYKVETQYNIYHYTCTKTQILDIDQFLPTKKLFFATITFFSQLLMNL